MNFGAAILFYLLVLLVLLWATSRCGMSFFSSVTFTALIAAIVLIAIIPPAELDHQYTLYLDGRPHKRFDTWVVGIYAFIMVLTVILVSAYVIFKAFEDRNRRKQLLGDDYNCDHRDYFNIFN